MDTLKIGDEVIWRRANNTWGRIRSERVRGTVIAVTGKRVRIKLTNGVKDSLTALVQPNRLTLA